MNKNHGIRKYAIIMALGAIMLTGCTPVPSVIEKIESNINDTKVNDAEDASTETEPQEDSENELKTETPSEKHETQDSRDRIPEEKEDEKSMDTEDRKSIPSWVIDSSFMGVDGKTYVFSQNGTMEELEIKETSEDGKSITYSNGMVVSLLGDDIIFIEFNDSRTKAFRENGSQEWLFGTAWMTDDDEYAIKLDFNEVGHLTAQNEEIALIERNTANEIIIGIYRNGNLEDRYHLIGNGSNQASITLQKETSIIKGKKLERNIPMYITNRGPFWLEDENLADEGTESFEFERNGLIEQGTTEFGYADDIYVREMSEDSVTYILSRGKERARIVISRISEGEFFSYQYVEYRMGIDEPIKKVTGLDLI